MKYSDVKDQQLRELMEARDCAKKEMIKTKFLWLLPIGAIAMMIWFCKMFPESQTMTIIIFWGILGLIAGFFAYIGDKYSREAYEELNKEIDNRKAAIIKENETMQKMRDGTWQLPMDKLKPACEEAGIKSIDSDYDFQKAKAIVLKIMKECGVPAEFQEQYLTVERLQSQLAGANQKIKAEQDAARKAKLKELRKQEKETHSMLIRYAEFVGRDKWIAMVRDALVPASAAARDAERRFEAARKLSRQSGSADLNPYLAGGIASGLAGPGAGLAAAMDAERQNEEDRARAKRSQEAWSNVASGQGMQMFSLQGKESLLLEELEHAQTAAISDMSGEDVLKKLTIKGEANVTETGAIVVDAKLSIEKPLDVFGDVPTKVDGTIAANLYLGEKMVGTALLVLPREGVTYKGKYHQVEAQGICLCNADPKKKYTIKYEPHHLWIIEAQG